MKKVTVLIPCYNEAAGIGRVIQNLPRTRLTAAGYALDVLVVDNNSTDNTAEVARQAGARVIHEPKRGKGNAIKTGFYSLCDDTDFVVMMDGDNTYRSEEILRLIEPIDSGFGEVILGSRMYGEISAGSMPRLNRWGNRIYSGMVRSAYGVPVTDVLTGYYAWSVDAIKGLRPHLKSSGFSIEMEMITKMAHLGYKIYSVPISYDSRQGSSNLSPIRDGYRIMRVYVQNLSWKPRDQARSGIAQNLIESSRSERKAPVKDSISI